MYGCEKYVCKCLQVVNICFIFANVIITKAKVNKKITLINSENTAFSRKKQLKAKKNE